MRPVLLPFRAEHIMDLVDRDGVVYTWDHAVYLERGGPAFSGLVGEKTIVCAGVCTLWPGVGGAWVAMNNDAERYGLWITRTIRAVLADIIRTQGHHRVEVQVDASNERNLRWIRVLGFHREGSVARFYTSDRKDMVRFERLT